MPAPPRGGRRTNAKRSNVRTTAHRAVSRPAAAGHRRLPAHDRAPVRGAREVRARARGRDEGGQADPPGRPEERLPGRPDARGHLLGRDGGHGPAAPEAPRRHRQGAGRGRPARAHPEVHRQPELLPGPGRDSGGAPRRAAGGRGHGAHRGVAVRAIHQAQPQDPAGGAGFGQPDRRPQQAGGFDRLPSDAEDPREAGAARDRSRR